MNPTIFTEAFVARLVPVYTEVTLGAVRHFKFEEYPPNAALAAVGALLASAVLYAFGVWLRRMPERVSTVEQQERIKKMQAAAGDWLPWLLILSPTPLGGITIIASAFFRINPKLVLVVVFASEILFRAMPYLR